ncbi:hypothetical protein SXANM310S_04295 [Streptomyces xanthochromogenes]|uniref:TauD/TfdA-like domain-containing protein n=1 Tax=Streptomyces xanthochromogenes TaxID=67384 RepID=A0ABQ2ZQS1_9ACTN|nr:hypothetical protein GCM10010326_11410 [Streptomyces xanthochromogenes]
MSLESSNPIRTEPVTGAGVWRAGDFSGPGDWTEVLEECEIAEVERALAVAKGHGSSPGTLSVDDFPLPTVKRRLEGIVDELEFGRGFAVLRGLPVEKWTVEDAKLVYWGIGLHLGTPVSQNAAGELMAHVRDHSEGELGDPSVETRAYRTRSELPFHTDSADIVGLLCLRNSGRGGESTLASSMTIYNHLLAHHRELLGLYYRGFVYDRRAENAGDEIPYYRNSVYGYFDGLLNCRFYMTHYIESATVKSGIPLSDIERHALELFQEIGSMEEHCLTMKLRTGDIQLLNNNVVVHGRSAFQDEPGRRRDLLRLWLNTRKARKYPDDFAAFRFGMPKTQ